MNRGTEDHPDRAADLCNGDSVIQSLLPELYDELRALANSFMARESAGHTLQPTALVHEAYQRLLGQRNLAEADRSMFLMAAAATMRRVLVDHARGIGAIKRGGGVRPISLDASHLPATFAADNGLDVQALNLALGRLEALHSRAARVVELRFFAGLSAPETARVLSVSERLVFDDWSFARAFLHRELKAIAMY